MKAQLGLEYIVILTVVIALITPLFYLANQRLEVSRVTSEARLAVDEIVTSVNTVYAQTPGSKLTSNIFVPNGYENQTSYIANKTISMKFKLADGRDYEISGLPRCNVSGRLPPYAGYHVMTFILNQNGIVLINTTAT